MPKNFKETVDKLWENISTLSPEQQKEVGECYQRLKAIVQEYHLIGGLAVSILVVETADKSEEIVAKLTQERPPWFGKGCSYLCAQWEGNEYTDGPNWKDSEPVLKFCNHKDCPDKQSEGNCNEKSCPLKRKE